MSSNDGFLNKLTGFVTKLGRGTFEFCKNTYDSAYDELITKGWINNTYQWSRGVIYDTTIGYWYTQRVIRKVISEMPDNVTILDIGIGTGYTYSKNADLLKKKNIKIIGVDIDPHYVKRAKHAIIDSDLEDNVSLVVGDIYEIKSDDLPDKNFDYVMFSDSYAVIPNVHDMLTFCEKFCKDEGKMVVVSTLFDEFDAYFNWFKEHIVYFSTVEFGKMMLKDNLRDFLREDRGCSDDEFDFKLVSKRYSPYNGPLQTYMVTWSPQRTESPDGEERKSRD